MGMARKPDSSLAVQTLPAPLYRALTHIFADTLGGTMLVGGTALAGYYAGHRRSDDLDLFTDGPLAQKATVQSVKSLRTIGAVLTDQRSSGRFHHATCRLDGHDFTAQVVLDPNILSIGTGIRADDGVTVASPETLLKMKAATLVSRASEKDLYDLAWFLEQDDRLDVPTLIALGREVDAGVDGEAILVSLVGTTMRKSACGFSRIQAPDDVLATVVRVQKSLIELTERYLREQPAPPIAQLIHKLR
jgi:hypothetical protein